jgi:alpha-L-arabinofuranosidase
VFGGEYAAQSDRTVSVNNRNNWQTALAEAAFMTGLERNADVVVMASYAPLFAHIDGWQWTPDLIWIDNLRSYGTPNYYTQKLFSTNRGTHVVPVLINNDIVAGKDSLYASATLDKKTNEVIIKVVNTSGNTQVKDIVIDVAGRLGEQATQTVLKAEKLDEINSFNEPTRVKPVDQAVNLEGKTAHITLLPYSFNVVRAKIM